VILLASNQSWRPWLEDKFYLPRTQHGWITGHRLLPSQLPPDGDVFTDDWNPVDAVIARQLLAE
jgi:hypothetical protein